MPQPATRPTLAQTAFDSLPTVIQEALPDVRRVVIIANNPSITTDYLSEFLREDDMLVLFNHFIHADFFSSHPIACALPKLLFFRQIGDSALHFGLPPRANNVPQIIEMAARAPLGIMFGNAMYQYPAPSDDPSPNDDPVTASRTLDIASDLRMRLDSLHYSRVLSEHHPVVADYPYFTDIHSSAASSGFLLYRLLLALRTYQRETPLELTLLGFNHDAKTPHFWQGHNWQFEREEMRRAPDGVRVVVCG
ncbi:hypothetical protein [Psychrobacter aestuarii]|uniref:Uncharacterized protein n=1 Tax=Psychrobacter aestuarii TaxID=556327 RepID=A0ABN0W3P4_9GAMM|nr:hypothetical protein [Psychrobacter aestuarii]